MLVQTSRRASVRSEPSSKEWSATGAARWLLALLLVALVLPTLSGCGLFYRKVRSDPGFRWWLFSNFGTGRICPELLKSGMPLRLSPGGNVVGRFFPDRCHATVDDPQRLVTLVFGGTGYAWTPLAGRVGFSVDASVAYHMDFTIPDPPTELYVWGSRPRVVWGPRFLVGSVENKAFDLATRSPAGYLAETFGAQIATGQLSQGFTVIHDERRGNQFALGVLVPPQRPRQPFDRSDGGRYVLANETAELHASQLDFLGPYHVTQPGQALFFRHRVQGHPIDLMVYTRMVADPWREAIQKGRSIGPAPALPVTGSTLLAGDHWLKLPLDPGSYYVVLDNSPYVGQVAPPFDVLKAVTKAPVLVSYTVEMGDRSMAF